jgi:hypothetical protein
MNIGRRHYQQKLAEVNEYMRSKKLPHNLRAKVSRLQVQ